MGTILVTVEIDLMDPNLSITENPMNYYRGKGIP